MRACAALVASVLLAGCTITYDEVGVRLPLTDGLEVGLSSKSDALALLGPPHLVRRQFDGEMYTWRRMKSNRRALTLLPVYVRAFHLSNEESKRDDLSLLFDREGVLRGMGRRVETEDGERPRSSDCATGDEGGAGTRC